MKKRQHNRKSGSGGKREGSGRPKRDCPMRPVQVPDEMSEYIKVACEAVAVLLYPQDEKRCKYSEEERITALKKVKPRIEGALEQLEARKLRRIEEEMNKRQYHIDFENNK